MNVHCMYAHIYIYICTYYAHTQGQMEIMLGYMLCDDVCCHAI